MNTESLGGGLGGSSAGKAECVLDWVVFEELVGDGVERRGARSLWEFLLAIFVDMRFDARVYMTFFGEHAVLDSTARVIVDTFSPVEVVTKN